MKKKYWQICDVCFQLKFANTQGQGAHRCPDILRAKRDAELDMAVDQQMTTWEESLQGFWDHPKVKFEQYLLEQERDAD